MNNIDFYYDEIFDKSTANRIICSPLPNQETLEELLPIPADVEPDIASMCIYRSLSSEQEFHLFRKMNYYKYLANCEISNNEDDYVNEECNDHLAQAVNVRNLILKHNTRLLYDIVKAYRKYIGYTTSELFSEASLCMVTEIIDNFDFRMKVPFGAFVSQCLRKRIWNYLSRSTHTRRKVITGDDVALMELSDYRSNYKETDESIRDGYAALRDLIWDHVDDEKTRDILFRRLGVNNGVIQSFEEIAKDYNLKYQTIQEKFDDTMKKLFGHTVNGNTIRSIQGRIKDNG